MRKLCLTLIILFLSTSLNCLHFQRVSRLHASVQSQLQALRLQQSGFETQVNSLISNITDLDSKVKASNNTSEKVILLENAIISERETVFNISNSLILPFNLSKNACQQLTNQQKINLLDQVSAARQSIAKIKATAATLPPCTQIKLINTDIQKQSILLDSIEKAIYTKCDSSIILSATIFQSNIYASNWILGDQTIDDLIEQYYQRSIQYDNVTNCPLEFPFFDGSQCIQCSTDSPLFNMFTKKCDSCPADTQVNTNLRKCQQIQHYSDYSKTKNFNLDGAQSLPTPDPNLTPCPAITPFWNGTCIKCKSGKWWSVKDSVCKSCPAGQAFDGNTKSCVVPSGQPYVTVLEGTQWVTAVGNVTNVLKERAALLQKNNTLDYCSFDTPYFDGYQCINCDLQFNLTTLKCTSPPTGSLYDDNIHSYVPKDIVKQTNTSAPNVVSSSPLVNNPNVPDCDISTPYYDGIACIACPDPFVLFNTTSKKCVVCEATEVYNKTSLKCQKRPVTLISTNFNRLLASPSQSIDQYKQQLLNIVNNKSNLIDQCTDPAQYSNFTNCFKCAPTQYFNVQTKKCFICNGTINITTSTCIPKSTFITNLVTAPNLLITDNSTISDYDKKQKSISGPIQACPASAPYAVQGSSCIPCTSPNVFFDLSSSTCQSCPKNSFYNNKTLACEPGQFVTNITALGDNYYEVQNYTLINIQNQINQINKTKPIIECSKQTPVWDGTKCNSCPNGTYVSLKNFTCTTPVLVTNTDVLRGQDNVFQQDNYTIDNIEANNNQIILPTKDCPPTSPVFNGISCYSCPETKFYKLKTNECVDGVKVSNIPQLKTQPNVKQTDNYTLDNIQNQISSQQQLPTIVCNQTKPLFNGQKCVACDSYSVYDLKNSNCTPPQLYSNTSALRSSNVIELGSSTLANIDAANDQIPLPKKPCPQQKPLFNSQACTACPNGTYYNLQALNCTTPVNVTNVDAIKASNNFIETDNYTLANVKQQIASNPLPTTPCNASQPLFDGKNCISCANAIYDVKSNICVICSVQNFYNPTTHKCSPKPSFYPNSSNNNWVVGDPSGINNLVNLTNTRKNIPGSQPCPQGIQFFNNNTLNCQSCPTGQLFNYDTYTCVSCPAGQQVDPNTHVCSTKMQPGLYQTNINTNNLIYNGLSKNQLQDKYDSNRANYPNIKDCPADKPFFDGYACISCYPSIEYFNVDTLRCQNCGTDGAVYDINQHDCIKATQVINTAPNPAKMYSSIF